jgi:putative ABC transport system permease protein
MFKNYLVSNLRALWKNRSHALINMLGLALGITCAILIFLIVQFELSYDTYHAKKDRLYRIVTEYHGEDEAGHGAGITYPLVPTVRQDFSDPDYVTIVDANFSDPVISHIKEVGTIERFKEKGVAFVDSVYFKMFDYDFVAGNENALARERTVAISQSIAKKYFGDESALNKVITFNNEIDATVTAVFKDPPLNTDFPFHIIFSFNVGSEKKRGWDNWGATSSSLNCYILLNPNVTEKQFESKMKGWHYKYFVGDEEENGKRRTYLLQPLNDVHFNTDYSNFGNRTVSKLTLWTLSFIGVFLLITACINFINLNTVLIVNRSKEAGIRKVMGSSRTQLVAQFLGETFIITIISLLISTGLVELAVIYLQPVLGYQLDFHPLTDLTTFGFLVVLPIIVTLLSGLYPGISLSRFQPVQALKNKLSGKPGEGITLRRGLIVVQLMISQVLVVSTIIVVEQINHFMAQPLGINSEAVIEFEIPENKKELVHAFLERIENIPGVQSVALSNTGSASGNAWGGDFEATINGKLVKENAAVKFASADYLKTYGIRLLYGEDLIKSDTATRFLANESLVKLLGFKNFDEAIGVPINLWGNRAVITGIINDFHANSLHEKLQPMLVCSSNWAYHIGGVRVSTTNTKQTLATIEDVWRGVYPNYVFESKFLDETIAAFYDGERKSSYLIGIFAAVAIFIGCIGLFGLISFMAKSRTKEVGIRKTLGASVGQVVSLFSKEFVWLIIISFVLSAPMAYYFMEQWLDNFAYRIHPGIATFLLGVGVTFLVVITTVGFKSYKAAVANPVDALRDE